MDPARASALAVGVDDDVRARLADGEADRLEVDARHVAGEPRPPRAGSRSSTGSAGRVRSTARGSGGHLVAWSATIATSSRGAARVGLASAAASTAATSARGRRRRGRAGASTSPSSPSGARARPGLDDAVGVEQQRVAAARASVDLVQAHVAAGCPAACRARRPARRSPSPRTTNGGGWPPRTSADRRVRGRRARRRPARRSRTATSSSCSSVVVEAAQHVRRRPVVERRGADRVAGQRGQRGRLRRPCRTRRRSRRPTRSATRWKAS